MVWCCSVAAGCVGIYRNAREGGLLVPVSRELGLIITFRPLMLVLSPFGGQHRQRPASRWPLHVGGQPACSRLFLDGFPCFIRVDGRCGSLLKGKSCDSLGGARCPDLLIALHESLKHTLLIIGIGVTVVLVSMATADGTCACFIAGDSQYAALFRLLFLQGRLSELNRSSPVGQCIRLLIIGVWSNDDWCTQALRS